MPILDQIAVRIVKEQELIVGPLAWHQASKVQGLRVDEKTGAVSIIDVSHGSLVLDQLVGQYEHLFGRASREVCREAAAPLVADLPAGEVPASLR